MAAIVVPGVCRFSVNQTMAGQPVVNIIDMQIEPTGLGVTREEAIREVAGDIINNWSDHILEVQVDNLEAVSVSWVDLDSLDGSTGSRSSTDGESWPKAGSGTGAAGPGMLAFRLDKEVAGGRRNRNGRMYLAGIAENWTDDANPNTYAAEFVTGMQGNANDFLSGISDPGVGEIPAYASREMVVVTAPQGAVPSYVRVAALRARSRVASQVRRTRL